VHNCKLLVSHVDVLYILACASCIVYLCLTYFYAVGIDFYVNSLQARLVLLQAQVRQYFSYKNLHSATLTASYCSIAAHQL
jgi:hypothetical protein